MRIFPFLLIHSAQVKPLLGHGAYGPIYGDPINGRCRIEPYNQLIRNEKGAEIVARYRAFFDVPIIITTGSMVIFRGQEFEVISVAEQCDFDLSHIEVYLQ
ncbi:hypothetical protein SAMN06265361_10519 [Laceyella tengchongensis]|jgi:hypothetical protein|uniref:Uncharacterized protein n=1 Tax=Laceyella tengchongensis TaxID=574699 RepID=A0AA45WQB0_9BACL|nr:hypothetical protein [Laceyella tengchongensis]SMP25119.1 hypothetical protein SAMN06265361_10519 [Laceyella tengchongensis]